MKKRDLLSLLKRCAATLLVSSLPTAALAEDELPDERIVFPTAHTQDTGTTNEVFFSGAARKFSGGAVDFSHDTQLRIGQTNCAFKVGTDGDFDQHVTLSATNAGIKCKLATIEEAKAVVSAGLIGVRGLGLDGKPSFDVNFYGAKSFSDSPLPFLRPTALLINASFNPPEKTYNANANLQIDGKSLQEMFSGNALGTTTPNNISSFSLANTFASFGFGIKGDTFGGKKPVLSTSLQVGVFGPSPLSKEGKAVFSIGPMATFGETSANRPDDRRMDWRIVGSASFSFNTQ